MTGPRPGPRLEVVAAWAVLGVHGLAFLYLAVRHVLFPGFLEPLESDVLRHIQLAASGRPVYPPAGPDFISSTLMPLYYYVSAPLYALFGDSFRGPRLVSALAAVGSAGLVAFIAWKESRAAWVAALAAGLFFSAYRIMDACLTCAQPDALALLLLLAGYMMWLYGTRPVDDVLWMILLGLAAWTKLQCALHLFAIAGLSVAGWPRKRALRPWAIAIGVAAVGPLLAWLGALHLGSAFPVAALVEPGRWGGSLWHPAVRSAMMLACFVPFATVLAWMHVRVALRERSDPRRLQLPVLLAFSLLVATGTVAVSGSSNNHYLPFLSLLMITAALGARDLCREGLPRWTARAWLVSLALAAFLVSSRFLGHHAGGAVPLWAQGLALAGFIGVSLRGQRASALERGVPHALLLVAAQLVAGYYSPATFAPDPRFELARARLEAELQSIHGPVIWWPYGDVPADLTGVKLQPAPSEIAVQDVRRQRNAPEAVRAQLAPLDSLIDSTPGLMVLADSRLAGGEGWGRYAGRFKLVKVYGREFEGVRQSAVHWFGGGEYPRYLYRVAPEGTAGR